jgi:hypothetical protein
MDVLLPFESRILWTAEAAGPEVERARLGRCRSMLGTFSKELLVFLKNFKKSGLARDLKAH